MKALRLLLLLCILSGLAACSQQAGSGLAERINLKPTATPQPPPTDTPTPLPTWEPTPDLRPRITVQAGDTLWTIAAQWDVPLDKLIATNRLFDPSSLEVGSEIIIPITPTPTPSPTGLPTPVPTQAASNEPTATPTNTATPDPRVLYTVRSGDTLWTIAALHNVSVEALAATNRISDPALLRVGDVLVIPVTPTATFTPTTRTPTPTPTPTPRDTATPTPVPFTPPPINPPPDVADWPLYLADLINQQRFLHNLPPLRWNSTLARVAQAHAEECAANGDCSHFTADGADLATRLKRAGYQGMPRRPNRRLAGGMMNRPAPIPTAAI